MAKTYAVAGLGYGDEGKGSTVDYLVEKLGAKTVVRYNGGPQAAHHVVRDGKVHCFSHFGSGSFKPGVETYISEHMLVNPLNLETEAEILQKKGVEDICTRTYVEKQCTVITPMQQIVGQMREIMNQYGSCGLGIGETVRDKAAGLEIKIQDISESKSWHSKLNYMWKVKLDQAEQILAECPDDKKISELYDKIADPALIERLEQSYAMLLHKINIVDKKELFGPVVFEGAQGVLLDYDHGFWPHVTKTDTTFDNVYKIVNGSDEVVRIGVMRAYFTRHGNGPFVTEDERLGMAEWHNNLNDWQGKFRIGHLDFVALKYSLDVCGGVDMISLTNMDRIDGTQKVCVAYQYAGNSDIDDFFEYDIKSGKKIISTIKKHEGPDHERQEKLTHLLDESIPIYAECHKDDLIDFIEETLDTKVGIVSFGPEYTDKSLI